MTAPSHAYYVKRPLTAFLALLAALLLLAAACGDGDDDRLIHEPIDSDILPIVISSDLAVGENRFMLGLINEEDQTPVLDAELHLGFFLIENGSATLKFEADAEPIRLTRSFVHVHEDGERHVHEMGDTGAYVVYVEFDEPGTWGVEVTGTVAGEELEPLRPSFSVNEQPFSLSPGDPAPPSVQPTLADVDDIHDIDTSAEPIPAMHEMTIAEAVGSGRPTVIAFVTPAFCQSQICGPVKEVVDDLYHEYAPDANFIHVEPFDVVRLRDGDCPSLFECRSPLMDEWGLRTEPWVFIINSDGTIAAKFDGIVSYDELDRALQQVT